MTQMKSSASAQLWPIDSDQIQGTRSPRELTVSSAPWVLGIANVTATRRIQPKITETTTEVHMPGRGHPRGVVGFLGGMRRCVEARDRVLREQHAEPEHEQEREPE